MRRCKENQAAACCRKRTASLEHFVGGGRGKEDFMKQGTTKLLASLAFLAVAAHHATCAAQNGLADKDTTALCTVRDTLRSCTALAAQASLTIGERLAAATCNKHMLATTQATLQRRNAPSTQKVSRVAQLARAATETEKSLRAAAAGAIDTTVLCATGAASVDELIHVLGFLVTGTGGGEKHYLKQSET
ncbi:hypothetical protein ERJ75_000345400 [Trypanosoma vivax]|nr:hypothetical protein ERJ75_000345400 [Trypanosoma vivax]